MAATRRGGIVSVPGVYAGFIHGFLFVDAFDKGLTFKMGQTHVQKHMPKLLEHTQRGEMKPEPSLRTICHSMMRSVVMKFLIKNKRSVARSF